MQNQSFDHLFETFPGANGAKSGDLGYSQLDANGVSVSPTLISLCSPPPIRPWTPAHDNLHYVADYDGGKMDGFAKTEKSTTPCSTTTKPLPAPPKTARRFSMATIWSLGG